MEAKKLVSLRGLGSKPFRASAVEERLKGKRLESALVEEASSRIILGVDPLDDLHASAEFRVHLARLYTIKAIKQASSGR